MKLKMLIENKSNNQDLHKEHGIALYIETQEKKLLFDTGESGAFMDNAVKMGVDVNSINDIILSHAHSDHCGGLPRLLKVNNTAPVYISDKARREYYYKTLFIKENISVPNEVFRNYSDRICYVNDFKQIGDNAFLISKFSHKYPLVKSSKNLLVKTDEGFERDSFDHELALVIDNGGKFVIITGCSHNGALNMLDTIISYFPNMQIQALIGGFHLMGFPLSRLMGEKKKNMVSLGEKLLDYRIEKTYTCHCTGDRGFEILKETMGDKIDYFYTGMELEL